MRIINVRVIAAVLIGVVATVASALPASASEPTIASWQPDCGYLDEIIVDGEVHGCTHGEDDTVPEPRFVAAGGAPATTPAECVGTGTDGARVQLIYATQVGLTNRASTYVPRIREYAAEIDSIFRASAAKTGGDLAVRWVTTPGCEFDIDVIPMSAGAMSDFGDMIGELETAGYNHPSLKVLVFADASRYCGLAEAYMDDRPDPNANWHNGKAPGAMFGRVDRTCFGANVGAHELMHTLGAVNSSAPHASSYGHCTDDHEIMCYDDDGAGGLTPTVVCPVSHSDLFDCGDDDYFNTDPQPGNYLVNHWNTADSGFLYTPIAPFDPDSDPDPEGEPAAAPPQPRSFFRAGARPAQSASSGWAEVGTVGDTLLFCDWDGDGADEPVTYDPDSAIWTFADPFNDAFSFRYGAPGVGDIPFCGDWTNNGVDTPGVFRVSTNVWYLRNSVSAGVAWKEFRYGRPGSGDIPLVGDWNGDGIDTPGIFRESTNEWLLNNRVGGGVADLAYRYGRPGSGDIPLVGDWDGDGDDTPGIFRTSNRIWYLRNSHGGGNADWDYAFGAIGDEPAVADWNGDGADEPVADRGRQPVDQN